MTDTPTPTFPPVFPLLKCGRSKGTLGDPFLAETKITEDTEAILDHKYEPHCLRTAITQEINAITPKMKLKVDSSNFSYWEDDMAMLFDNFLDNLEYLTTTTGCTTYGEKLCHSILTHSYFPGQTYLICRWKMGRARRHLSTGCGASNLVANKLEAIVSTYSQPPNLGKVISAIESSTQQVTSQKEMTTPNKTSLPTSQKLNIAGDDDAEEMGNDEFLKGSFDPEALRAMVWGTCHLCKQQDHFTRSCPKNRKTTQERVQNTNMFQAYYPILTPSSMQPIRQQSTNHIQHDRTCTDHNTNLQQYRHTSSKLGLRSLM
ncbi:hypothetical protein O181_081102 [Austropuccinia psidii MF-1]|uniref:CCHC-type domain-containing protein n=1 Tax=Austropuccinia psidii MF-1 TaxID=1389203 RepID=A0A9Q3FMX5_9BASI|nr:hypothetical protein [Austropuccinia psidii MF-1]